MKDRLTDVLETLERQINYLSRRTFLQKFGFEVDDLCQEGRLKVIETVKEYPSLETSELIAVCVTSVKNLFTSLIRQSHRQKNCGIFLDLSEAYNIADHTALSNVYLDYAIGHLYELASTDARLVLDAVLDPPELLIERAILSCRRNVRLRRGILADHLGLTRKRIAKVFEEIKDLIPQAAKLAMSGQ